MKLSNSIGRLRAVGIAEGISYLLLLGIAMPLKYMAGIPEPVKVVGWAHGVLFVLFVLALLQAAVEFRFSIKQSVLGFLSSLVPFGTFWFDKQLKRQEEQLAR